MKTTTRRQFEQKNKKSRWRQVWAWPLIGAILLSLIAFLWFAFIPSQELALPPLMPLEQASTLQLIIGGDIFIDQNIATMITNKGYDYPFQNVQALFKEADLSYAQLDTVFSEQGAALPGKLDIIRAEPHQAEILLNSGLDLLGMASLHMMDYDLPALEQTQSLISGLGLDYIGAGSDLEQAKKPYVFEQNGLQVAIFNYCQDADTFYSYDYPRTLAATPEQGGLNDLQTEAILADLAAYKEQAITIVNLYWGSEFAYSPSAEQRQLAHTLIEAGADIIVGFSPHTIQSVEVYQNSLICYSLGNLLYDQIESRQAAESLLLELEISPLGWAEAKFHPLLLGADGSPALAQNDDATAIFERLRSISTTIDNDFVVEDGLLVLR